MQTIKTNVMNHFEEITWELVATVIVGNQICCDIEWSNGEKQAQMVTIDVPEDFDLDNKEARREYCLRELGLVLDYEPA